MPVEGTSVRQSLHSTGGSSGGTGTKPPVVELREYLEFDARVRRLEQREHIREWDPCGDIRSLLIGWRGSMLLEDEDDLRYPVSASTVSHFLRLARLLAGLTTGTVSVPAAVATPFGRLTRGACVSVPLLRRRPPPPLSRDLMPGMASRGSTRALVFRAGAGVAGDAAGAWGTATAATSRRPRGSSNVA